MLCNLIIFSTFSQWCYYLICWLLAFWYSNVFFYAWPPIINVVMPKIYQYLKFFKFPSHFCNRFFPLLLLRGNPRRSLPSTPTPKEDANNTHPKSFCADPDKGPSENTKHRLQPESIFEFIFVEGFFFDGKKTFGPFKGREYQSLQG